MSTTFRRVIVTGCGKVSGEVLSYVKERQKDYGYQLEFIEHELHSLSITEKLCGEKGISFIRIVDKKELAAYLQAFGEKILIISAGNHFLFPKALVEKENVTIINFHNALLPDYPGRNAPSWVIYEGEKETGITWHYVTAGIDEGGIIVQKQCGIGKDTKAYELTERLMELAYEAFTESFDAVMEERVAVREQGFAPDRRMYRSFEIPAGGFFELTQEAGDIYRLLRSVDYGKNDIFPPVRTRIESPGGNGVREAEILRYRKIPKAKGPAEADGRMEEAAGREGKAEGFLYLPLGEDSLLKLKYRMCAEEKTRA